ncbi:MAG: UDP-N-acetylmuramoyl-tripeptide--D-alanyl-D-alanine ligase [Candidatus Doudnabacteria bacterium]|nr:UDP-N-acetylmuramoyl-tripeptide--D-alanyl-D-alanine ligase [Candidatus Doudnabacteria bacterium]
MRKILEEILAAFARLCLVFHKPLIIGITGSVGKSSTKEAIAHVLRTKYKVRSSPGNLNSQLGLPLAVLGFEKSGNYERNLATAFEWVGILITGFFRIFQTNFPQVLVLEMGTDRPGDISELLSIVGNLDVALITDIGISHLEFFRSPEALKREKLSILSGLKNSGTAVLNADNEKVMEGKAKSQSISYGFSESADVSAKDFQITNKNGVFGISFKVSYKGTRLPFFLPNAVGRPAAYASLAAAAVGLSMGLHLVEIAQVLEKFVGPAGRLKLIQGKHQTTIIDDTYNAAPSSMIAALEVLETLGVTRKLAALGHMAELGNQTEAGHRQVAQKIAESGIDILFLVGEKTKIIQDELLLRKFTGKVVWFADSMVAAPEISQELQSGDVILVKGSQSARMEKIVKEIMLEPQKAKTLLVRQSSQWLK